jgi:hypothetical protein
VNAFPQELRSKRIYRIAGGYVVSAWLVLQVASVVAPSLGLPVWTLRALLGILLLGFSVALFAGWRLDVRAARASKLSANFHLMVWPAITLFLLGGVILVVTVFAGAHREKTIPAATGLLSSKSVAVLPFESLSDNKSDTYFADGVQDEILSNLAKVSELKVISRTSVMTYRSGGNRDLRSIASAQEGKHPMYVVAGRKCCLLEAEGICDASADVLPPGLKGLDARTDSSNASHLPALSAAEGVSRYPGNRLSSGGVASEQSSYNAVAKKGSESTI